MSTIDDAALERSASPSVRLLGQLIIRADGNSAPVGGFDAFERVYVELDVAQVRRGSGDAAIAFTIEQADSDEGPWTDAGAPMSFTRDGRAFQTVEGPSAFLRVAWETTGKMQGCTVSGVFATPGSLDPPASPGGSMPLTTLIPAGTEISTHQDDSWGAVPAFESLVVEIDAGEAVLLSDFGGLGEGVLVEFRIYDVDGKLIDGLGATTDAFQWFGISADGSSVTANTGSGSQSGVARGGVAIYAPGSQAGSSDPFVVQAPGISYMKTSFVLASHLTLA